MKPFSLRTRLALSFAMLLASAMTALGYVYYRSLSTELDAQMTRDLGEITSAMHGFLRFGSDGPAVTWDRNDPDEVAFIERATRYYQIYESGTGLLLLASPAMDPLGLHYTPDEIRAFGTRPQTQDVQTDQGRIRLTTSIITPTPDKSYLLQAGISLDDMDAALGRFLRLLLLIVPAGMAVAAVAGRWLAARALAPLSRVAEASRTIDVSDLTRRLPVRGTGDELDRVADAFNGTLQRLEAAVADMKQFSTALAHELRTPLAVLRAEAETALTDARSPEEYRRGLTSQIEELDRLTRLINQVLTLARAEAGEIVLANARVDLSTMAADVTEELEAVAQSKQVALSCSADASVAVMGDAGWLERLLINLIDNAVKFTPPGGRVKVSVSREDARAVLRVEDTGIGIAADALPHIFERFYQADASRSRTAEGAGLGLNLVRWIAQRHGATIGVTSEPGRGTTVTLRFASVPN
ncbi:MAG TPA: heavy metal sensor histidine kinase [Vicinamibacterales bacterium]|nr:heavy metal sensor histidine kinase [Vicinamibacterales bacterium]